MSGALFCFLTTGITPAEDYTTSWDFLLRGLTRQHAYRILFLRIFAGSCKVALDVNMMADSFLYMYFFLARLGLAWGGWRGWGLEREWEQKWESE